MTVTAAPEPTAARPSALRRFLASYLQPLVFVLGFPLAFATALHAPAPHDLSVLVVGPSAVVAEVTAALDATDAIDAVHTDDPAAAPAAVRGREADGAVLVEPDGVTTYVASGGGLAAAAVVRQTGERVAAQLGLPDEVVDVAPLATGDGTGTGLFFLLTYTSLGGYVTITGLMQFRPRASLRMQYAAAGITAIGSPLLVFGLSSVFVGDYGLSAAHLALLLAVGSLYVFTVATAAILLNQLLGRNATAGIMAAIVVLNFPSAGGAVPASMLPSFWRAVHGWYFGAAGMESFRSLVYFDGAGLGRWVLQLGAWTARLVALTVIVGLRRTVRALAPSPQDAARHLAPAAPRTPTDGDAPLVAAPVTDAERAYR